MGYWNEFVKAFTRDAVVRWRFCSVQDLQETGQWLLVQEGPDLQILWSVVMCHILLKTGGKAQTSTQSSRDLPLQRKTAAQQLVPPTFYAYKLAMLECTPERLYNHDPKRSAAHTPESNRSVLKLFYV